MLAACINKLQGLATTTCSTACNGSLAGEGVAAAVVTSEEEGEEGLKTLPPEVLEVLDYLSVALPAVRIVYDWVLGQEKLYLAARAAAKPPLL